MQKDRKTVDDLFKSKLGDYRLGDSSAGWSEFAGKWSSQKKFSFFRGGNGLLTYSIVSSVALVTLISVLVFNKPDTEALYLPASQEYRQLLASPETETVEFAKDEPIASSDPSPEMEHLSSFVAEKNPASAILSQASEPKLTLAHEPEAAKVSLAGASLNQTVTLSSPAGQTHQVVPTEAMPGEHAVEPLPVLVQEEDFLTEASLSPTGSSTSGQLQAANFILSALKPLPPSLFRLESLRTPADLRKLKLKRPAGLWTLTLFTSLSVNSSPLSLTNPLFADNFNYLQNQLSTTQTDEYGLRIGWSKKDWLLESGISLLQISQKSADLSENISFQENFYWNVFDTSYVMIDTVGSYFQIINNDTTWFYFTSNQIVNAQDSLLTSTIDTLSNYIHRSELSRIRYIDLPLIAGYRLPIGSLTAIPKAGIITSILQSANGNLIEGPGSADILPINQSLLPKLRFDMYLALEATYPLGGQSFISAEGYIRRSLSDEYYTPYISRRLNRGGIKLGIGMNF